MNKTMKATLLLAAMLPLSGFAGNGTNVQTANDNGASTADSSAYYPTAVAEEPTEYEGYRLTWHDEFNIDGPLSDEWSYEEGFVRNRELQWYQPQNARVKGGCLVITGKKERVRNPHYEKGSKDWRTNRKYAEYTSSCVTTSNSFHFKYGRMEVRARIPQALGSWPAIWTLGNRWRWPVNGEIDLMEYYLKYGEQSILANACWSSPQRDTPVWDDSVHPISHFLAKDKDWFKKFHVWRMDWDKQFIRLYLDGELMNEIDLSKTSNQGFGGNYENPFSNDIEGVGQYILLNLAIGSSGGTPDDKQFPLHYDIDYVRVYQH